MDAKVLCSAHLPHEVIERVLSFLPVPTLCRLRCVCKRWNDLTREPAFHDLCDLNGAHKQDRYMFVTCCLMYSDRHQHWSTGSPVQIRPQSILDLERNRWYTIPTHVYTRSPPAPKFASPLLAMDDGLIFELSGCQYNPRSIMVSNPVAATRRQLPLIPQHSNRLCPECPKLIVATAVDPISRTYRIAVLYLLHRCPGYNRTWMYESFRNAWRGRSLRQYSPSSVESAVFFHGVLYVICCTCRGSYSSDEIQTLNPAGDEWNVIPVSIPCHALHPRLVVSWGRLCMMQWIPTVGLDPLDGSPHFPPSNSVLEIVEIVVDSELHHDTRSLVQMTSAKLRGWFGEEGVQIACAIPMFGADSSGDCRSVVLMSKVLGKIMRRNLVSGVVEVFTAHQLEPALASSLRSRSGSDRIAGYPKYIGNLTNLSLRSLTL